MDIKKSLSEIKELSSRFGLSILYLDFTDVTLIARIGNSLDVFIQIYLNTKKSKLNMALVVKGERFNRSAPIADPCFIATATGNNNKNF